MKIKVLLSIILACFLFSCENGNVSASEGDLNADIYYVKYEAIMSSVYSGNIMKVTVASDYGNLTFEGGKSFSQTFGPVSKGFKASIKGECLASSCNSLIVNIYVCRGSEPFALKSTGSYSTSYTIDY